MPEQLEIMGTIYSVCSRSEIRQVIDEAGLKRPVRIATLNPEFMLDASTNAAFKKALSSMSHCTIDGFGLYLMLHLFNHQNIERYTGADLVAELFQRYSDGNRRIFLLGGLGQEAAVAAEQLRLRFPKIAIVGAESGGTIHLDRLLDPDLEKRLVNAAPDILLVGFGAPKQELWIQAASQLKIPVMIGVGGSFNFYGTKRRAPAVFRLLRIEWLYRGLTEPNHWRRVWRAVVIFPLRFINWQLTHAQGSNS